MSKSRQPLKLPKVNKNKPVPPETDDEYLAAGVKEEEGGEKWRAGDSAKSFRFFTRAIDIYASGLQRHPRSFDLAYNKARLQYDVSQQPRLLTHQPVPLIELLFTALDSHRYALQLSREDTDVMFNTAQVLVSISEALIDNSVPVGSHDRGDAAQFLEESIQILQKCLLLQRQRFEAPLPSDSEGNQGSTQSSAVDTADAEAEEQWASIEEPITASTLLDTCLAEMHARTILTPLLTPDASLFKEAESQVQNLLQQTSTLVQSEEEKLAFEQATFNLRATCADHAFRSGLIDGPNYAKTVSDLCTTLTDINSQGPALCDCADALIVVSISLATDGSPNIAGIRWEVLSSALQALAKANTNPGDADRSAINARRGDAELLRTRLGDPPVSYGQAHKNRSLLLKNAETYYEGARKLASVEGDTAMADIMTAKRIITNALREGNMAEILSALPAADQVKINNVMGDMAEEGLIVS